MQGLRAYEFLLTGRGLKNVTRGSGKNMMMTPEGLGDLLGVSDERVIEVAKWIMKRWPWTKREIFYFWMTLRFCSLVSVKISGISLRKFLKKDDKVIKRVRKD